MRLGPRTHFYRFPSRFHRLLSECHHPFYRACYRLPSPAIGLPSIPPYPPAIKGIARGHGRPRSFDRRTERASPGKAPHPPAAPKNLAAQKSFFRAVCPFDQGISSQLVILLKHRESLNIWSDLLLRRYGWQRFGNEMTIMEASLSSPAYRPKVGHLRDARRSRVTNGRDLLPNIDGRSVIARRYRDITNAILGDQGGIDRCSESRLQLIRRFAAAAVLAEQLESRLANGETIDINEHATLSSTLVRLSAKIGIDRVPRDVTPTLAEYLETLAAETIANDASEGT